VSSDYDVTDAGSPSTYRSTGALAEGVRRLVLAKRELLDDERAALKAVLG
jgi:hypothetical protein